MSEWKAKRFWTQAQVVAEGGGFGVHLDTRPVRTPAKAPLVVPTREMAQEIAAEWDAQEGEINPHTMPFTRSANAAIDKVSVQHAEVADLIADYGDADLLCYRAAAPAELVARQTDGWDPLLDWAATALGARLVLAQGVMHVPQPPEALSRLRAQVHDMDAFYLTAFHDLVSLSGSLVLGFAVARDHLTPDRAWTLSRIDEAWQAEHWGADDEATEHAAIKQVGFLHAKRFFDLSGAA